jgi:hypothetical protein
MHCLRRNKSGLNDFFSNMRKEQNMMVANREELVVGGEVLLFQWILEYLSLFKIVEDKSLGQFGAYLC